MTPPAHDEVECVARALAQASEQDWARLPEVWNRNGDDDITTCGKSDYRADAAAAIAALDAHRASRGMVLVPAEPTEAMVRAWSTAYPPPGEFTDESCARADWRAMLAAREGK